MNSHSLLLGSFPTFYCPENPACTPILRPQTQPTKKQPTPLVIHFLLDEGVRTFFRFACARITTKPNNKNRQQQINANKNRFLHKMFTVPM